MQNREMKVQELEGNQNISNKGCFFIIKLEFLGY